VQRLPSNQFVPNNGDKGLNDVVGGRGGHELATINGKTVKGRSSNTTCSPDAQHSARERNMKWDGSDTQTIPRRGRRRPDGAVPRPLCSRYQ
jgi:hypothetical protein